MWNIFNAVKGWFGGNDDEEEKRKRQQQATPVNRPTVQQPSSGPPSLTQSAPERSVPVMPSITNKPKPQDPNFLDYLNPFGEKGLFGSEQQQRFRSAVKPVINTLENTQKNIDKGDDEEGFQWSSPGDYKRFAQKLPVGMAQGLIETPEKVASAVSGRRINDVGEEERLNPIQRTGSMADAMLSSVGLMYGGSGAAIKSVLPGAAKNLGQRGLLRYGTKIGGDALKEGVEETAQTFAQDLSDDGLVDTSLKNYLDSFLLGGLGGSMMSGAGTAVNIARGNTTLDTHTAPGTHVPTRLEALGERPEVPVTPPKRPPVTDPGSAISAPAPTATPKPQAITSPNRPQGLDTPRPAPLVAPEPPVITPPPQAPLPEPTVPPTPDPMVEQLARQLDEQATLPQPEVLAPESAPVLSPLETQVLQAPPPPAIPQSILEQAARAMAEADAPSKTALSNVPEGAMAKISDDVAPRLTPEEVDILSRLGEYKSGRFEPQTEADIREINRLIREGYAIGDRVGLNVRTGSPRDIDGRILDFLQENEINSRGFRSDGPSPSQMLERNRQLMGDDNLNMVRGRDDVVNGQRVDGYYQNSIVNIVEGKGDLGTVDHEVVHRAFDEFVGPEQRTAILDQIKQSDDFGKTVDDYVKKGYEANPDLIAEEKLADDFMRYAEAKRGGKDIGPLHISPKVLAYFDRVWEGMKSVVGKQDNAKQLFSQLETGKFRNADPTQAPSGYTRLKASPGPKPSDLTPGNPKFEALTAEARKYTEDDTPEAFLKWARENGHNDIPDFYLNAIFNDFKTMDWGDSIKSTVKQPNLSKKLADDKAAIEARRVERNKKRAAIEAEEQADLLSAEGRKVDELFGKQEVPTLKGRTNPQTGEVSDIIETPDGPELVVIKEGTKQTPKEKFAESLEMGEADGVLPTVDGKSKATTGKTVSQTATKEVDPRIKSADEKAAKHIAEAKKAGVDYPKLVAKVYRNSQIKGADKLPEDLTSAEKKVWSSVKKDLDDVVQKLNEKGITDEDLGYIQGNYLPTTKKGDFGRIETAQDVANKEFGFGKTRQGTLDDSQVEEGAQQALEDYLRTGALIDDVTPQQIDRIKQEGMEKQTQTMLEGDEKSPVKVTLDEEDIQSVRQSTKKVVEAERKVTETTEKIKKGDKSDDTLSARNQAIKEADEAQTNKVVDDLLLLKKKIDSEIEKTKASKELSPAAKKQRIKQLQERYNTHEYRTRYLQTYTRSNALFQVPGRLADQVNKGVQAISDTTVGVLGRLAENKSFKKAIGRPISADRATVKGVMQNIGDDPRLNPFRKNLEVNKLIADKQSKSAAGRKASRYRIYATAATEAGSNYKGPVRETVSFFAAKAQAEGLTDIGDISRYVQDQVNTKEWKRVYGELYRERNAFTGVPLYRRDLDGTIDIPKSKSDAFFTAVDKGIEDFVGKVGITNPRAQREIADMIRIPLIGFPRVMFNLGTKGFDHATLGARDFYAASKIVPTDEASALRKALLLRSGVESAAGGAAVGALGLSLGAAGMISGAYPEDPAERARWQEEKKQPYSIKLTGPDGKDQWFDVSRYVGPYAFPLLLGSQMSSGDLSPKDIAGTVGHIAQQVAKNFGTDSVGAFFEVSAKALKGDMEGVASELERFLPNMIGMGIPVGSQLNAFGKLFDDTERSTEGDNFMDSVVKGVQRKIPGLRDNLDAKTGAFGDPITENSLSAIAPVSGGQDISGSVRTELSRLAEAGVEAYPGSNTKKYSLRDADGNGIKLKKSQQTDLDNAVKKEKARQADLVMTSETYKKATDQEKGAMLKTLYTLDSSAVASEWAKENGIAGVKSVDEKINNSIPRDSQQALIEHKLQGDKKDQWLDDIDNAASYHTANYKNAEANDSLDYDDKNLFKKSSKRYKMVAAQTNKDFGADIDLIKLYENTNKTEFKNMPEGPEKQRLREFDATRAGKGVSLHSSDHNKPKYGAAGGSGSGSGGRGKTTVSLPSILSASSRGGTSEGYAKGDRLFKPQKALLAPDGTSNTVKVPGISVKRGVHL